MKIFSNSNNNFFFLLAGHKVDFIAPCGTKKPFSDPIVDKKSRATLGKIFIFPSCIIYYFLLAGNKLHFISPCGAKKSIFDPPVKVIVCNTGKTFILRVFTGGSKNRFVCNVEGNKMHFITRMQKK